MPRGELSKESMHLHCERLRRRIENSDFDFGETRVRVTISLGFHLALMANGGQETSLEQLIGKADEALYRAKELGRNRTENLL
jgi:diguanylate cyclase (GGDEF)-like protein